MRSLQATTGLAQRSLYDHVAAVLRPLAARRPAGGAHRLGKIVGRDTTELDASGVAAAALGEPGREFNDGVVAPAFWLVLRRPAGLVRL